MGRRTAHRIIRAFHHAKFRLAFMATHLDLDEQEQLDQLKAFWKQLRKSASPGSLIVVLAGVRRMEPDGTAWQTRARAPRPARMFDQLDRAAFRRATRTRRAAVFARHEGALSAYGTYTAAGWARSPPKLQARQGSDSTPPWQSSGLGGRECWSNDEYQRDRAAAGLPASCSTRRTTTRHSSNWTPPPRSDSFSPLADDRRGDVLLAQGKKPTMAQAAYLKRLDGRWTPRSITDRLIEAKLTVLGAPPGGFRRPRGRGDPMIGARDLAALGQMPTWSRRGTIGRARAWLLS